MLNQVSPQCWCLQFFDEFDDNVDGDEEQEEAEVLNHHHQYYSYQ